MLNINAVSKRVSTYAKNLPLYLQTERAKHEELVQKFLTLEKSAWSRAFQGLEQPSVSTPVEEPSYKERPAPRPSEVTLCATDGSQIFPDRNQDAKFLLINIGEIVFQVGVDERAFMQSSPTLYFSSEPNDPQVQDIFETDVDNVMNKLSAFRAIKEITALYTIAREHQRANRPLVAIADGTLICWSMKNLIPSRTAYIDAVKLFELNMLPVVSYISYPASKDAVSGFAAILGDARYETILDRHLWKMYLEEGERSAVFQNRSEVLAYYSGESKIYFCYIKVANEVVRIEFPKWVFSRGFLPLVHAVVLDEARKNRGYPRILAEAHEQAVVKQAESEQFYNIIEDIYTRQGFVFERSAKVFSKKNVII